MREQYIHCLQELLKWSKGLEHDPQFKFVKFAGICYNLDKYLPYDSNIWGSFYALFRTEYKSSLYPIPNFHENRIRRRLWKEEQLKSRQKLIRQMIKVVKERMPVSV